MIVEDILMRHGGVDEITACSVQNALRLAGGAGGVEDEQRVFGVHLFGRAVRVDGFQLFVEPVITLGIPWHVVSGAPHHQNFLAARAFLQCRVGVDLERDRPAAANTLVGGDDVVRLAVSDASGQCVRREAAEHDRVDRPEPGASKHGIGCLGHHGHVDGDPVALADAMLFHDIGKLADRFVQLFERNVLVLVRLIAFPDDRHLIAAGCQMPVDTIGAHVQSSVFVPFDRHVVVVVRGVLDLGVGLDPVQPLAMLGPKCVGIVNAGLIHLQILVIVDVSLCRPFVGDFVKVNFRHGKPPPARFSLFGGHYGLGWPERQPRGGSDFGIATI